jgi:hypothetical protein
MRVQVNEMSLSHIKEQRVYIFRRLLDVLSSDGAS